MLHQIPAKKENKTNLSKPYFDECRTKELDVVASLCIAGDKKYFCDYFIPFDEGFICTNPLHSKFRASK
jgi:hypothetical protein